MRYSWIRQILFALCALLLSATACESMPAPPLTLSGTPLPQVEEAISAENVTRVTQLSRWDEAVVGSIAYSPDGQMLAVASSMGIYFYDTDTLAKVKYIDTGLWITCLAFSPDGKILAAGSRYPHTPIQLWRVSDRTVLYTLDVGASSCLDTVCGITHVAFSPDGQTLASALMMGGAVQLWRIEDETLLRTLTGSEGADGVTFTPDGQTLVSWTNSTVHLWAVNDGTLVRTIDNTGVAVAVSPQGNILASGDPGYPGEKVRLWDMRNGKLLHEFSEHKDMVLDLAFAPNGQTVAASSRDATVQIWQVDTGLLIGTIEGFAVCGLAQGPCGVHSLAFSPDSKTLAAGDWRGIVRLWQVSDGVVSREIKASWAVITAVAFSPDGEILASGSGQGDNKVKLWRVSDGALLFTLEHPEVVTTIAFSADGQILAAGSMDGTVLLWRVQDGRLLHTLDDQQRLPESVGALAFRSDDQVLAASLGRNIYLWQTSDGRLLQRWESSGHALRLAFQPDGQLVTIEYNTTSEPRLIVQRQGLNGEPTSQYPVTLTPGWQPLIGGADHSQLNNQIELWDLHSGKMLRTLQGHLESISDVTLSPDGRLIASSSEDGTIRLWGIVR